MPKISFSLDDLYTLVGRKLDPEYVAELLENSKCEVEGVEGGTVEIEVTSDRPDMFSVEGIARYLKGVLGVELGIPRYRIGRADRKVYVDVSVKPVRPFIASYIVRGVRVDEKGLAHLMQFQEKLHQTLCRDRKKASIGLYDLSKVSGDIYYRALPLDEVRFTPLDGAEPMSGREILRRTEKGRKYAELLGETAPLLVDSKGQVLSMPPIINSEETRVTTSTRDFFIDVTGFDWEFVSSVATLIALNMGERGGLIEPLEVVYSDGVRMPSLDPEVMGLHTGYVNKILGLNLTQREIGRLLMMMRYDVDYEEPLRIHIPRFRLDILHPIDLVEDVAIAYGYNNFTPTLPSMPTRGGELPIRSLERFVREIMVGMGFQEIMSYMMTSPETQVSKMGLSESEMRKLVEVENPVSLEYRALRIWLLPNLLEFLGANTGAPYPHRIFEIGYVVERDPSSETLTRQELRVGAAITAYSIGFEDIQAALYAMLRPLGVKPRLSEYVHPSLIPGRSAKIFLGKVEIGFIGEVSPEVLLKFNVRSPVAAFEISLDKLWRIVSG